MVNLTEVRISVRGLRAGMYVVRLDRPWIETPFALQGLMIGKQSDIETLARYCTHVYVDIEQGLEPDPRHVDTPGAWAPAGPAPAWISNLRQTSYRESGSLESELPKARQIYETFSRGVEEFYSNLNQSGSMDLSVVRAGTNAMVESVLRNPDACGWLVRFKDSDSSLYRHALGCAVWAAAFGRHLGLARHELDDLVMGCILMDAGKTLLPRDLLEKPGRFDENERLQAEKHVTLGLELLKKSGSTPPVIRHIVVYHHERHDGKGYFRGLRGDAIPLFARIASVIDSYDALTNARPHRAAMSPHEAISFLYQERGRRFQPELVEQFIQAIGIYPSGTLVELNSGEVAVVVSLNGVRRLKPRVMVLLDAEKNPYSDFDTLDLRDDIRTSEGQMLSIRRGLPPGAYGIRSEELYL